MPNTLMGECNSILAVIEKDYFSARLHDDFSKKGPKTKLNGLFVDGVLQTLFEKKSFKNVDMGFLLPAGRIDRCPG